MEIAKEMEEIRRDIVSRYVEAYNHFDIDGMVRDLDEDIIFENVTDGQVNLRTEGVDAFRAQADKAKTYFQTRRQMITKWFFDLTDVTIHVDYHAILGMDFPNGMKKGEELTLTGTSTFTCKENKIVRIVDKS